VEEIEVSLIGLVKSLFFGVGVTIMMERGFACPWSSTGYGTLIGRKSTHVVFLARERNRAFARIVRRETTHSLGLGVANQDQSKGTALVTVFGLYQ
jgi:hypothetical protein